VQTVTSRSIAAGDKFWRFLGRGFLRKVGLGFLLGGRVSYLLRIRNNKINSTMAFLGL